MKRIVIIVIALVLLTAGLLAKKPVPPKATNTPNLKERPVPMDPMLNCAEDLKLTEAQIQKFDELRMGFEKTQNTIQAEIENMRLDQQAAMKAENYSKAKELNKQIYTKKITLADARIDFMSSRMKELNAEQKELMKQNMMGFDGHRNQMHGRKQGMNKQGKGMMKGNCGDCGDCSEGHGKEDGPKHQSNKSKMR